MKINFSTERWLYAKAFLLLFAFVCFNQIVKAQDAFMGYGTTQAWATGSTAFNDIKYTIVGNKTSTKVCGTTDNVDVLTLSSSNDHYMEIDIPNNATKEYIINVLASSNGSSSGAAALIYSGKSPFDESNIIGTGTTATFVNPTNSCTLYTIMPPANAKSLRLYRRIDYYAVEGVVYPIKSGSSGRTQIGDNQTIRLSSVEVWATARPTVQASTFTFVNVTTTSMDVNFTRGDGSKVVVFAKEGTGAIANPTDNSNYTANSNWATGSPTGSQLGASGYFCVYNGTENTFSITNLKPNTSYTFQAFEYSGSSTTTKYLTTTATANPSAQTTKPLTAPTLTTSSITSIFSTKGTSGGVVTDNGGAVVTETGLVWDTSTNPTTVSVGKLKIGTDESPFNAQIKGLTPSTTYYVRAYAINSIGTSYGNQVQFTTAAPAPVLASSVTSINFGDQFLNATPAVLTYNLENNSANFSTATGNITVTAPAGFLISTNASSGFSASITVPYINSKLASTPVYVKLPTNLYGNFSGEIIHSGANVLVGDADKVTIKGAIVQQEVSNMGSDFWLGFGYMVDMNNDASNSSAAKMVVYVATGNQTADVTVSMPNGAYTQTKTIAANSIEPFENFPIANKANLTGDPDSRLFATGIQDKGINVNSNGVPVSVWTYTYTKNNSSAGAMIFPTDTWSSSYTVQAYGGQNPNFADKPYEGMSNQRNPNSFFYVIAAQDNTNVTFTPSNPIVKSSVTFSEGHTPADIQYQKGVEYTIALNKGQIFNAQGYIENSGARSAIGLDLSGTTITTNDCDKKIAVFAGTGRSFVTTNLSPNTGSPVGSDNLVQQMFPLTAWGTKYLTVPTKTMEYNVFRIYVRDNNPSTTVVKINGTVLGASYVKNNLYYEYETNEPVLIESDKPTSVAQFIVAQSWGERADIGNIAKGDPEMIILSPIQQAIKSTIVATPDLRGTDGASHDRSAFINVILQKEGIASFKLDGVSLALDTGTNSFDVNNIAPFGASDPVDAVNAFKSHPHNPDYVFAKFRLAMGDNVVHTVSSDYPFTAIAYGLGQGESYAFNAGTAFRDLSSIKMAVNTTQTDTSSTTVKAARGKPVTLRLALAYEPSTVDKIAWMVPSTDATISPAGSKDGVLENGIPKYEGPITIDGAKYYVYSSPVQYTFSEDGVHNVYAIVTGTFGGDCGGADNQKINVLVGLDNINIGYTTNCGDPTILFTNTTTPMEGTTIKTWLWDFGDGTTSDLQNPPAHTYNKANGAVYTVKLTTTNTAGIQTSKTLNVDFSGEVIARFTNNAPANAVCLGNEVRFDPANSTITSTASGTANKWTWNFGDGTPEVVVNGAAKTVQPHTYATTGQYTVTLQMETTTGCSNTFTQTINVFNLTPAVISSTPALNSIEFKWEAVPDATAYQVSTDGGLTFITPSSGSTGLSHTVTGLSPDQTVNILVQAKALGACESVSLPYSDKTLLPELDVFVPNTFTPNGDGKNDVLLPYSNYMQSVNLRIFNQWGQQVFNTTELNKGWDGTYKGDEQPVGVYIYVVSVVMQNGEKINKKGSVNLIR